MWLSEGQFWVFPRAQIALFLISTLNSFRGLLKVSCLQWSWCHLCRDSWQSPVSRVPSWPHIWPCSGGISWPLCPAALGRLIPRSREGSIDRPLNVLFRERALWVAKSLDHTCLTSHLVQENNPFSSFFLLPISRVTLLQSLIACGAAYQHFITGSATH